MWNRCLLLTLVAVVDGEVELEKSANLFVNMNLLDSDCRGICERGVENETWMMIVFAEEIKMAMGSVAKLSAFCCRRGGFWKVNVVARARS